MISRIPRALGKVVALAAAASLVLASAASADQFQADNDGLVANGTNATRNLGAMTAGSSTSLTVGVLVASQGTKHVSFPVAVTISTSGTGISAPTTTSGSINTYNTELTTGVTITAPSSGLTCGTTNNFQARVNFDAPTASNLNPNSTKVDINYSVAGPSCNTAPSVSVTGVTNGASYEHGSVPAAGCQVVDAEDGNSTPAATITGPTGPLAGYGLGSVHVACSYTDAGGLSASAAADYSVVDTVAPALSAPGDATIAAESASGAHHSFTVSATDAVDPAPNATCDQASGSLFPLGTTLVSCAATDAAGNSSRGSFNVTVTDQGAPSLTMPSDVVTEATSAAGAIASYDAPVATDDVDASPAVDCDHASPSQFALGHTTVTCTATDAAGNSSHGSFDVLVHDTTAPALPALSDVTAEATSAAGAVVSYDTPSATDAVTASPGVECTPASATQFALGHTTVTCTATDAAGNSSSANFDVIVQDTTAPALPSLSDVTAEATSASGATVTFATPAATDVVTASPVVVCSPASESLFALGHTPVTCTATDGAGNSSSAGFDVIVQDTTAPALPSLSNVVAEATSASGATVSYGTPSATDAVTASPVVGCSPTSGSTFALGHTTVTCTATDGAGNSSSSGFDVIVMDTTAPALTVPSGLAATATSAAGAAVTYTGLSATDAVTASPAIACTPASGSTLPLGSTTVSCTATDGAGNSSAAKTFKVIVTYSWSGVLQPINADGSSVFKLGSTIPVKFQLTNGSANVSNAVAKLLVSKIDSGISGTESEATSTSAADSGNTFRWDPTARQYIFNLGTKTLTAGTYKLRIDLGDGTTNTVQISIKK
jgi:hypothetical protein